MQTDPIADKAKRLFTYLRELTKYKTRTVRDIEEWDKLWFCEIPLHRGFYSVLNEEKVEQKEHIWLEVSKIKEPKKPAAPLICKEWIIETQEEDTYNEPKLKISLVDELLEKENIISEFNLYLKDWRAWSENHKSWHNANSVYEKLFYINEQLKKLGEQYELIICIGYLTWETPTNQIIKRHIVVGDAELIFEPDRGKFQLQGASEGGVNLRFEVEMLEPTDLPEQTIQIKLEDSLTNTSENPWNKEDVDTILRSWVQSISPNGEYSDSIEPPLRCSNHPTVTFAPALILRKRTQQTQIKFFEKIIENIASGTVIPDGIKSIFEFETGTLGEKDFDERNVEHEEDEEIYMPLAINEEQERIVRETKIHSGVLVQGPPGTGKSHTIANLICHLLASGKRILVTSQTPRALKVLKRFIPGEVDSLCVSLLGRNQDALQELEKSVQGINQTYLNWNSNINKREITSHTITLSSLKREINAINKSLMLLREKNTYKHTVANRRYTGTAQEIAQSLKKEEQNLNWIPDEIGENLGCPLTNEEFLELVQLFRGISNDVSMELDKRWFNSDLIPTVFDFNKIIEEENQLKASLENTRHMEKSSRFQLLAKTNNEIRKELTETISNIAQYIDDIGLKFKWVPHAIDDMLVHNSTPWWNIYTILGPIVGYLEKEAFSIQGVNISIPTQYNTSNVRVDASALLDHLSHGGRMGWKFFAPQVVKKTRYIMQNIRVDGYRCNTISSLENLIKYIDLIENLEKAWEVFKNIDDRVSASLLVEVGYLKERLKSLESILNIKNQLDKAIKVVKKIPRLIEPRWNNQDDMKELNNELLAAEIKHKRDILQQTIEKTIQSLRSAQSNSNWHEVNNMVISAIKTRNIEKLKESREKISSLDAAKAQLDRRTELFERLFRVTPSLAGILSSLHSNTEWDEKSKLFESAWAWRQADTWISSFNQMGDYLDLEDNLKQLEDRRKEAISKLASLKAWAHCMNNLTEEQRQNLIAWAQEIKRIGKGTGKHAPKHRRWAQQYMEKCKDAIPAWIMPLYRVFETVEPKPEIYDVVICDEASQTGPEGLALRYLGKQNIIVGDSEQISPEEVIVIDDDSIDLLIKRYLEGIPFQYLYNPRQSLFSHAERYRNRIPLREHFRCMPEIIQFSNMLCYQASPLIPLRQFALSRLEPVLTFYVPDGIREGEGSRVRNEPEANALVNKLLELCNQKGYEGKSIGIISLQGEEQARLIQQKLHQYMDDAKWDKRNIVCGDAYAFQGDERDIIFLSMVAAPNKRPGAMVRGADKRRFNVAASRARDQMILFHSVKLEDLNPECMRYKLLEYCINPAKVKYNEDISNCESEFEKSVCQQISSKGYMVIPQFKVAGKYIDLMVMGEKNRLAVECNGDKWHGPEREEQDLFRQRQLERCGCRFFPIKGSDYYRNPEMILNKLWVKLEEMNIHPVTLKSDKTEEKQDETTKPLENVSPVIIKEEHNNHVVNQPESHVKEPETIKITENYLKLKAIINQRRSIMEKGEGDFDIHQHPPAFFYSLAHWGKETNHILPWERSLVFHVGNRLSRNIPISDKQRDQCIRIVNNAFGFGFKYKEDSHQLQLDAPSEEESDKQ